MKNLTIGIDIGGTSTKLGLVDSSGKVINKTTIPMAPHKEVSSYLVALEEAIANSVQGIISPEELLGIGIGAPNANFFKGTIENATNLPWKGVIPFVELLRQKIDVPSFITNDANAAAIGEMIYGDAKGMKDFVVITLGTGLGSGLVAGGEIIYGHDGFAGELGHMTVKTNGRQCGCGKRGCLETYVSATGLKRTVFKLLADFNIPTDLRDVSYTKLSTKSLEKEARNGDIVARRAFQYTGKILGLKLSDTIVHTSPEAIFLLGGLANAGDLIFEPTKYHMEKNLMPIFRNKVKLLSSGLNYQDAAILGASSLVLKHGTPPQS